MRCCWVETNTHAFDADPIGYWTKILLGDRMYAFVRPNKCVTFEERRDRAWLSHECSVKRCTILFCMHPFVKQCLIEETSQKVVPNPRVLYLHYSSLSSEKTFISWVAIIGVLFWNLPLGHFGIVTSFMTWGISEPSLPGISYVVVYWILGCFFLPRSPRFVKALEIFTMIATSSAILQHVCACFSGNCRRRKIRHSGNSVKKWLGLL